MKTRAIIIAAGEEARWDNFSGVHKHMIEVDGEPIIHRGDYKIFTERFENAKRSTLNYSDVGRLRCEGCGAMFNTDLANRKVGSKLSAGLTVPLYKLLCNQCWKETKSS